jgi:hypothetical protein
MHRLIQFNRFLGNLIRFEEPHRRYGEVAKDALIGGGLSAAGTAGLLAATGLGLRRKAPALSKMLTTAAGQHIKVFNPMHTAPMMRSLPEASRLFGKQLAGVKEVEHMATSGAIPSMEHVAASFQKTGINPEKDIADIAAFKKKWGRTPGESMEKSVGLLSGLAATGVGAAGGAALSKGWGKRREEQLSARLDDLIEFGRGGMFSRHYPKLAPLPGDKLNEAILTKNVELFKNVRPKGNLSRERTQIADYLKYRRKTVGHRDPTWNPMLSSKYDDLIEFERGKYAKPVLEAIRKAEGMSWAERKLTAAAANPFYEQKAPREGGALWQAIRNRAATKIRRMRSNTRLGLSSKLDDLIEFSLFSDTKKLIKHLKEQGVEITRGVQRHQFPTGYYPAKMLTDPSFAEARSAAPQKRFVSVMKGETREASAGMSPIESLWHEAGHSGRRSSQVNPMAVKGDLDVFQIAAERGANRHAMKLADQLGVSPESRELIRKGLKKSFKTYKRGLFEQKHYSWESGKRMTSYPPFREQIRKAVIEGKKPIEVGRKLQETITAKKMTMKAHPWLRGYKFSIARNLFSKVKEIQFKKKLYQPGVGDEPPEELPQFREGEPIDYTVQRHAAKRAGLHRDIRIGTRRHGLLSWATRKDLPSEGGKVAIHPQPVHPHSYLGWEGNIPEGYGAGDVATEHLGKALVTKSTPTEVHATLADQKEHHRLAFVKTPRGWLLARGKHPEPPREAQKPKYKSVSQEDAPEHLSSIEPGTIVQPKVDGALVYVTTEGNRPEVFSHRKSKVSNKNILHTERVFHGRPTTNIPKEHQRTLLGELYGTRRGKAIEPQELGGILNTHLGESIAKQKIRGVKLKIMPFDYADGKGESYPERLEKVKSTLQYMPKDVFQTPPEAKTPSAARALYEKVRSGRHPLTKEGVIIHPPKGKMIKIKNVEEENVKIHSVFPGKGKFEDGYGGFYYADKSGQPLGRVGTGFTEETRAELPKYIGRTARVRHQGKYKSGKLRAPSLIAIEENK